MFDSDKDKGKTGKTNIHRYFPWINLLPLMKPQDFIVSVDQRPLWLDHLVWAKPSGEQLRNHTTQRYASNMVFMSLVLSSELGVGFSPSDVCTEMRQALKSGDYNDLKFWIGICLILSIFFAFTTLITTFTAWAIVSSISDKNSRCILRSSLGLQATSMPSKTIVVSLYFCASWMTLFMIDLLPYAWGVTLSIGFVTYFLHVITVYSSLGKLIMYTGAMGRKRIFSEQEEIKLLPHELQDQLILLAKNGRIRRKSLSEQYATRMQSGVIDFNLRDVEANLDPSLYDEEPDQESKEEYMKKDDSKAVHFDLNPSKREEGSIVQDENS